MAHGHLDVRPRSITRRRCGTLRYPTASMRATVRRAHNTGTTGGEGV